MDKNFFKFDIDDEVLAANAAEMPSEKEIIKNKIQKETDYENLFCLRAPKKSFSKQNKGFDKQVGLESKREINPNLCQVEDYINFDFRARKKNLQENSIQTEIISGLSNKLNDAVDLEVKNVIEKAQIGVIFY